MDGVLKRTARRNAVSRAAAERLGRTGDGAARQIARDRSGRSSSNSELSKWNTHEGEERTVRTGAQLREKTGTSTTT